MNPILKYLLDKIVPALLIGIIVGAINLYIDVQILKKDFNNFKDEYYDIVVQVNNQFQKEAK